MSPNTIREMEPRIRQRFHFAASSFSRIFGVNRATSEMIHFCIGWAEQTMPAPLEGMSEVDIYFKRLWEMRFSN